MIELLAFLTFFAMLVRSILDYLQTRNLTESYIKGVRELTANTGLIDTLEAKRNEASDVRRALIDSGLNAIDLLASLTPDTRDDVLKQWTAAIRDGKPNTPIADTDPAAPPVDVKKTTIDIYG